MTVRAPAPGAQELTRGRWMLVLLVLTWGITWPAIKIGVTAVPPIWYGCERYLIATVCLFIIVRIRGDGLAVPSRSDWRLVAVSGVLQMGVFSALAGVALTQLPAGRAAVLAYSTPLWVVPLAYWWLREHVSRQALGGVGVGLLGMLVIAAPALQRGIESGNGSGNQVVAYAMLLAAAGTWALSIVFVRAHRFEATTLALAPWQTLVAAALLCPLAIAVEGGPPAIGGAAIASLAFVGPIATAFAYWAVVELGRLFPASTISMALLGTPCLGLLISALTLGETVDMALVIGIILVGVGIRLATTGSRTPSS